MIDVYSSSGNLGDNLGLTALAAATPIRVHMYNDAGCREIARVFDGLCEVVFDNGGPVDGKPTNPYSSDDTTIPWPLAKRHLIQHGILDKPAIPVMRLTEAEIERATQFVLDLYGDSVVEVDKLCIIKGSPQVTDVRTPPVDVLKRIIRGHPETTFLSFGLSSSHLKGGTFAHMELPRVKTFWDIPIREQAAIYHVVGRYIGVDTGDYHMMLAVGGQCDVLVPAQTWAYQYRYFHYGPECWLAEKPRVWYHDWRDLPIELTGGE